MSPATRVRHELAFRDFEAEQRRIRLTQTDAYGFCELSKNIKREEVARFEAQARVMSTMFLVGVFK